ncbi:hypothetical protein OKA06_11915 [Novosphingobium sp. MW5]|nr:hypothetical protein [Novosphingobium sp. MW5]
MAPKNDHKAEFRALFEERGIDTRHLFYFGESVLLPEFRGRGIGHDFVDHREVHAAECGATAASLGAIARAEDHPAR